VDVRPFRIDITDSEMVDLRRRLHQTRWPDRETVDDWSQGIPLAVVGDLCEHWGSGYDWVERQALLNRHPQVLADIGGMTVHAVHARSPHPGALPIVLTHGWPGSFVEYLDLVDELTRPSSGRDDEAFHVVIPSLPGYGFSSRPSTTGWGVSRIARLWADLMSTLGYGQFGAAGSDWSDHDGDLYSVIDRDRLLDNLTVYWVTRTGASSARLYWESFAEIEAVFASTVSDVIRVPVGASIFPREVPRASRRWAERRFTNIVQWHEHERGGHFAAMERPDDLLADIRSLFRPLRPG
jgi:hypothetical protein